MVPGGAAAVMLLVSGLGAGVVARYSPDLTSLGAPAARIGAAAALLHPLLGERHGSMVLRRAPSATMGYAKSYNWSGYDGATAPGTGVEASWTVPKVKTSSKDQYSSSWIGVDGTSAADPTILQAGTEQDTTGADVAWVELYPAAPQCIASISTGNCATVKPGDHMLAAISPAGTNLWSVGLEDVTQNWQFGPQDLAYTGPGASVEWIVEAPTSSATQKILPLADFGSLPFSKMGIYGDGSSGVGWYVPNLQPANGIEMVSTRQKVLSIPSKATASSLGADFTEYFVTAPTPPRKVAAHARVTSAEVSWEAPTSNGHTPIVHYLVRVFRGSKVVETERTASKKTSWLVKHLVAGQPYSFAVAAVSSGGYTSKFSSHSAKVTPTK